MKTAFIFPLLSFCSGQDEICLDLQLDDLFHELNSIRTDFNQYRHTREGELTAQTNLVNLLEERVELSQSGTADIERELADIKEDLSKVYAIRSQLDNEITPVVYFRARTSKRHKGDTFPGFFRNFR